MIYLHKRMAPSPSPHLFQELEVDDPCFNYQWEMGSLNQSSQQLLFEGDINQQYNLLARSTISPFFCSESSPSSITFSCPSMGIPVLSSAETPRKMHKSISWSSCTTHLATNSSIPTILQFQSPGSPAKNKSGGEERSDEKRQALTFHAFRTNEELKKDDESNTVGMEARPTQAQDHIMAERKRRQKLNQRFIELSAIIPNLKKMDKASVLGSAVKYVKDLQEKAKHLEDQNTKSTIESRVIVKRARLVFDDDNSSSSDSSDQCITLPEVEVKLWEKAVLIRIHCENHKGVVSKVLNEIEKLHLTVTNASIQSFPLSTLHITVTAQTDEGFSPTVKDLVKKISSALNQLT